MNGKWEFIELEDPNKESLDRVGQILMDDPNTRVHVSIFTDDDQSMANGKVEHIKNYITSKYHVGSERIHTSWFRHTQNEAII